MPFPKTAQEFKEQGYKFKGKSYCKSCGALMYWYVTPKEKFIPLNADNLDAHFATCPAAKDFRK